MVLVPSLCFALNTTLISLSLLEVILLYFPPPIFIMQSILSVLERLLLLLMSPKPFPTSSTNPSAQTVHNNLKKAGMKAVVRKKKPLLSHRHRKERMDFALEHQHWTVEDWKRVVWSVETKVNRLGSDGRKWAGKKAGEGLSDRLVGGTLKFGGGSLMVWGCMQY